jgi:hypothetical protein
MKSPLAFILHNDIIASIPTLFMALYAENTREMKQLMDPA